MQLCSVITINVPVVRIYDNTKPQDCVTSRLNECVITVNKLQESFYITFIFLFPGSEIFTEQGYELEFSSTNLSSGHPIVLKQGDTLNLTCKITSRSSDSLPRFKITIHTPYSSQNRYVQSWIFVAYHVVHNLVDTQPLKWRQHIAPELWCLEVIYMPLCKSVLRRFCMRPCSFCSEESVLMHVHIRIPGEFMDTCI